MAKNIVSLWNLALGVAGSRARISQENQRSYEADVIRQWYEPVRDIILCAAHWSCAESTKKLPLIAERDFNLTWQDSDPEHPWAFVYGLPADFLYARYLDTFVPFKLTVRGTSRVLLTNTSDANLCYTNKQANVGVWTDDLYMAVAKGLGAAICQQLNGKMQRAINAQREANDMIMSAKIANANEQNTDFDSLPDWLIARGVGLTTEYSRFINPTGSLLAVVSSNDS